MFALVKTPMWERADEETKEGFAEIVEQLGAQVEEVELFPSAHGSVAVAPDDHGAGDGAESRAGVGERPRSHVGTIAQANRARPRGERC